MSAPTGGQVLRSQGGVTDYQWTQAPAPGPQEQSTPVSEVRVELSPPISTETPPANASGSQKVSSSASEETVEQAHP